MSCELRAERGQVHVWQLSLSQPMWLVAQLWRTLAPDEQARADRFRFDNDRRLYIAGRGLLRAVLAAYLDTPPAEIGIAYGPHGKPYLADAAQRHRLSFNLSHADDVGLLVAADCRWLGVDIERVRPLEDIEDVARVIFSDADRARFESLPAAQRQRAFFDAWSRKEAVVKACGAGFSMAVPPVEVSFLPDESARLVRLNGSAQAAADWTIQSLDAPPGYRAAVAWQGEAESVVQRVWLTAA